MDDLFGAYGSDDDGSPAPAPAPATRATATGKAHAQVRCPTTDETAFQPVVSCLPRSPRLALAARPRYLDARAHVTTTQSRIDQIKSIGKPLAPDVDDFVDDRAEVGLLVATNNDSSYNAPRSIMLKAPLAGPSHPNKSRAPTNVWSGQATDIAVASYHFDDMFNRQRGGGGGSESGGPPKKKSKKSNKGSNQAPNVVRPTTGIALDRPFYLKSSQPWADEPIVEAEEPTSRADAAEREGDVEAIAAVVPTANSTTAQSVFHGTEDDLEDYQGRSWIDVPKGYKYGDVEKCRLPKKAMHTWSSHSKGVSVRLEICVLF